jgi:hypothetical protein
MQAVLEVESASRELSRGLVSALGWLPYQKAETHIQKLVTAKSSDLRRIGIATYTVHRRDPGQWLIDALFDSDQLLKARVLSAVGQLGRVDLLALGRSNFAADDYTCRFAAVWSAALLGDMNAVASFIPWLFEQMTISEIARVTGEAFTMITGVDLAEEDLEGEWLEGFEAGPTENPEDENIEMDPDENLPWPNPTVVQRWWAQHGGQFHAGTRYLLGRPIGLAWLQQVLRSGRQRQRAAAALELALRGNLLHRDCTA